MLDIARLRALLAAAPRSAWDMWHWASWDEVEPGWWQLAPRAFIDDVTLIVEAIPALPALLDELERLREALTVIAEDDDLVQASGGAWGQQAYERRRNIARSALSPDPFRA